ncbi:MAG: glycosyltransferase [Ardenticatenaceae bacterium]|nr:glycosyltransferase [Ardenticatenaceae bacterium]
MTDHYPEIHPDNTVFVFVSFEGPDRYSLAGGLGVRVSELGEVLARQGYQTHLIFVGEPSAEAHEVLWDGRLALWRVCQEISCHMRAGVYEGEQAKLERFQQVVPSLILERIARPAATTDQLLVVIGEDWHAAATMSAISDVLYWNGLRRRAILLWNANNTFGFDQINWARLAFTCQIMTVSRYMKQRMMPLGVNPLVVPNGIPGRHLEPVSDELVECFQQQFAGRLTLTKFARFDPNKNWLQAMQAVTRFKALGLRPLFFMRGGVEGYGHEVLSEIDKLGLRRCDLRLVNPAPARFLEAVAELPECDLIFMRFFVPEDVQRLLYRACDAVLANSGHEPFGLVGLEVMAAQGIAITGSTGEDYAQHLLDAVVLDTDDPSEIVGSLLYLRSHPELAEDIRRVGGLTSRFYVWETVLQKLISKLQYLVMTENAVFRGNNRLRSSDPPADE